MVVWNCENQVWMAENLNYETASGSYCYDNSEDSCAKYGRLYTWSAAMGIEETYNNTLWSDSDVKRQGACPAGWHLPNDGDWDELIDYAGGWSKAGTKLKSKNGWDWNDYHDTSGNGTDNFGFSALPGGSRHNQSGYFISAGRSGRWWSATEYDASDARYRTMSNYDSYVLDYQGNYKSDARSVRCVKD